MGGWPTFLWYFAGRKLSQVEIEAEARKLSRRANADDEEPLEWGTGLRQKKDFVDEQTRLREAARLVRVDIVFCIVAFSCIVAFRVAVVEHVD